MSILIMLVGLILTVTGYFGPEDGGFLELCGLVLIGLVVFRWLV